MTMRKILVALGLLLSLQAFAVVAPRTPATVRQGDGSVITIQLHGDEFHHWTTADGIPVRKDADGIYRMLPRRSVSAISFRGMAMRQNAGRMRIADRSLSEGNNHFAVILLSFDDLGFTVEDPRRAFSSMLNNDGYSVGGATGSLGEFFRDNSNGRFSPVFDVYGPYKVSRGFAYYGKNGDDDRDEHAEEAFFEAAKLADADIDYSKYDIDGDGVVDNIIFVFAGHDEAEYGGADAIWPYQYSMQYSDNEDIKSATFDGKKLGRYACGAELLGADGATMAGIGTIAHEFSHVLGLPDFYDVDGEENGESNALGNYSLMAFGPYNNGGNTPPYYSYLERQMLGWIEAGEPAGEAGTYTVAPVSEDGGMVIESTTEGESFIVEYRDGTSWDAYVHSGILIYHMDKSGRDVSGRPAWQRWSSAYASVNNYGNHPCYYIVRAKNDVDRTGYWAYPGIGNVTKASPKDWNGNPAGFTMSGITSGGQFRLDFGDPHLGGKVTDSDGDALAGAKVTAGSYSAVTGADGTFGIDARAGKYDVTASLSGYETGHGTVTLKYGTSVLDFILARKGERILGDLYKYDESTGVYMSGLGKNPESVMASVHYTADELRDYVGMRLTKISFYIGGSKADHVYVIVDAGSKRLMCKEIKDYKFMSGKEPTEVDITVDDIRIPEGEDMYIGYGLDNVDSEYPFIIDGGPGVEGGACYNELELDSTTWYDLEWDDGMGGKASANLYVKVSVEDPSKPLPEVEGNDLGFNYIDLSGWDGSSPAPHKLGKTKARVPVSEEWKQDGDILSVRLTYGDGSYEIIERKVRSSD